MTVSCRRASPCVAVHSSSADSWDGCYTWPLVLVSGPSHLGDQAMKIFEHPRPDATELTRELVQDTKPLPLRVYIEVWVVGLLPRGDVRVRRGWYQTRPSSNDSQVGVLNDLVRGQDETPKLRKILRVVERRFLVEGLNSLCIKAGAQGGNYNDFEIRRVAVHRTKPRLWVAGCRASADQRLMSSIASRARRNAPLVSWC